MEVLSAKPLRAPKRAGISVAMSPQSNPHKGVYHSSLIMPSMIISAEEQGQWKPAYTPKRGAMMKDTQFPACKAYSKSEIIETASATSLVLGEMRSAKELAAAANPGMDPQDETLTLGKFKKARPTEKYMDNFQKTLVYKPATVSTMPVHTGKKIVDQGFNNEFGCIMANSYQHDFVDAVHEREEIDTTSTMNRTSYMKNSSEGAMERWMQTRFVKKDDAPVNPKQSWKMKKFSTVQSKTDSRLAQHPRKSPARA